MHWMLSATQSWMANKQSIISILALVLMILLLPLRWLFAAILSALLHELGHYTAVRLLGGSINNIHLGLSGACMYASGLTPKSEVICLLAGPLAGLLPLLVIKVLPITALCGVIQTVYNLLPVYPLDGGKILRRIIILTGGTKHSYVIIEYTVMALLILLCFYIRYRFGVSLFLIIASLLFRNIPCKQDQDWI